MIWVKDSGKTHEIDEYCKLLPLTPRSTQRGSCLPGSYFFFNRAESAWLNWKGGGMVSFCNAVFNGFVSILDCAYWEEYFALLCSNVMSEESIQKSEVKIRACVSWPGQFWERQKYWKHLTAILKDVILCLMLYISSDIQWCMAFEWIPDITLVKRRQDKGIKIMANSVHPLRHYIWQLL